MPPWRVDVTVRPGVELLLPRARLARLVARTLEAASAPPPASVGLILSEDRELAELNERHMGERGPTDVLSFPLLDPGAYPPHAGQDPQLHEQAPGFAPQRSFAMPPRRRVHLGDVVVSLERAVAQAEAGRGVQGGDARWSAADELALLVVHGTLHLCGWDHARNAEAEAMRALERDLLAGSGISRPG